MHDMYHGHVEGKEERNDARIHRNRRCRHDACRRFAMEPNDRNGTKRFAMEPNDQMEPIAFQTPHDGEELGDNIRKFTEDNLALQATNSTTHVYDCLVMIST